ncbi:hypothetical protein EMCRGX_G012911 [Ephydatia muelleri]
MLKKDLRRKAYHPRAVQALKAPDAAKRAEDFLDAVMMDFHISSELMRPFFISRALSTSTMPSPWPPRINPHVYIERDTQKKSWGVVVGWSHQVIGPFFFDSSVTGDVYLNLLKRSTILSKKDGLEELDPYRGQEEVQTYHLWTFGCGATLGTKSMTTVGRIDGIEDGD